MCTAVRNACEAVWNVCEAGRNVCEGRALVASVQGASDRDRQCRGGSYTGQIYASQIHTNPICPDSDHEANECNHDGHSHSTQRSPRPSNGCGCLPFFIRILCASRQSQFGLAPEPGGKMLGGEKEKSKPRQICFGLRGAGRNQPPSRSLVAPPRLRRLEATKRGQSPQEG